MCEVCKPFGELTEQQIDEQVEAISLLFVGLPMVTGAPLVLGAEYWREVARHQLECGVRLCAACPPIKTYAAPTSLDGPDRGAGEWTYLAGQTPAETPRERITRLAREQQQAYEAEVARRAAARQEMEEQ